eukprot:1145922-Pelagomonas_calceolata.AAC.4
MFCHAFFRARGILAKLVDKMHIRSMEGPLASLVMVYRFSRHPEDVYFPGVIAQTSLLNHICTMPFGRCGVALYLSCNCPSVFNWRSALVGFCPRLASTRRTFQKASFNSHNQGQARGTGTASDPPDPH